MHSEYTNIYSGYGTTSYFGQFACGLFNNRANNSDPFIVGNGSANWDMEGESFVVPTSANTYSTAFRVARSGAVYGGTYSSSGADYAEYFEWQDGNPEGEDRAGRFVTLEGDKIRLAGPEDEYLVGIVSGAPSVCGDVYDDQWQGMYLKDAFGRLLWENAEGERRRKVNPDYRQEQTYLPRSQRPEWDAVGLLGKLVALDDGSCQVNGWSTVEPGGIATASESRTKYRVMRRLDESHVQILIL